MHVRGGENPLKVSNIVATQMGLLKGLYAPVVESLGVT